MHPFDRNHDAENQDSHPVEKAGVVFVADHDRYHIVNKRAGDQQSKQYKRQSHHIEWELHGRLIRQHKCLQPYHDDLQV